MPGKPVIAFTGDGGLGMTLMEIETAVRLRLPVIVVVFNDASLSLIKIKQSPAGHGGGAAVGYGRTSFAAAAAAMGAGTDAAGARHVIIASGLDRASADSLVFPACSAAWAPLADSIQPEPLLELARSRRVLSVPANRSALDVMRDLDPGR